MSDFVIEPEHVHEVAAKFRQASKDSREVVQTLEEAMDNLRDHWQSAAQQMFYNDYTQWREYTLGSITLLTNIAKELDTIADRFAAADK